MKSWLHCSYWILRKKGRKSTKNNAFKQTAPRLFTVLCFTVRSSRSSARVSKLLRGRGGGRGTVWVHVRCAKNRGTVVRPNNITVALVQEAWQEFHPFNHSLIKKLRWRSKTCQTRVYNYLLSEQWFYTVSGTLLQIKSANMLGWNIFPIQGLSMLGKTSR